MDISTETQLESALAEVIAAGGVGRIVVDLADVGFLDSSGIRVLLQARAAAEEVQVQLVVHNASGMVERVLRITQVDRLLGMPPAVS